MEFILIGGVVTAILIVLFIPLFVFIGAVWTNAFYNPERAVWMIVAFVVIFFLLWIGG